MLLWFLRLTNAASLSCDDPLGRGTRENPAMAKDGASNSGSAYAAKEKSEAYIP